jgi:hypothetical protein
LLRSNDVAITVWGGLRGTCGCVGTTDLLGLYFQPFSVLELADVVGHNRLPDIHQPSRLSCVLQPLPLARQPEPFSHSGGDELFERRYEAEGGPLDRLEHLREGCRPCSKRHTTEEAHITPAQANLDVSTLSPCSHACDNSAGFPQLQCLACKRPFPSSSDEHSTD